MACRVGIDVGGTFTDAVILKGSQVEKSGKIKTDSEHLLETIVEAIDYLGLSGAKNIDQITVSTTLVTNAILQNRLPDTKLVLFPGSGMKLSALPWPVKYTVLSGELDYRGREVAPPDKNEWLRLAADLQDSAQTAVAVSGKFSHRNNTHEEQLKAYLEKEISRIAVSLGSRWGQTNFYRRSLTAYLYSATKSLFASFASQLADALVSRGCSAPIRILKADGGVLPLEKIGPVESVYSGPAASVLGTLAQSSPADSYIIVDIGGTTTDIGMVLSGKPLLSAKGAKIGPYLTNIRSLAVRSVPVGGDSAVFTENGEIKLADYRLGPAACLGGPNPTPTDAMRFLNLTDYGSLAKAEQALASLLPENKREYSHIRETAKSIMRQVAEKIGRAIEQLQLEWQEEPAYKIWQVLHQQEDPRFDIRLSGGAAPGLVRVLEDRMKVNTVITHYSDVSNAIGAALAKPTFSWTLNLDTYLSKYRIEETGEQGSWNGPKKPYQEAELFLEDIAVKQAEAMGIEAKMLEKEPFDYFPLVENYRTIGQIIRGSIHVPPGVMDLSLSGTGISSADRGVEQ